MFPPEVTAVEDLAVAVEEPSVNEPRDVTVASREDGPGGRPRDRASRKRRKEAQRPGKQETNGDPGGKPVAILDQRMEDLVAKKMTREGRFRERQLEETEDWASSHVESIVSHPKPGAIRVGDRLLSDSNTVISNKDERVDPIDSNQLVVQALLVEETEQEDREEERLKIAHEIHNEYLKRTVVGAVVEDTSGDGRKKKLLYIVAILVVILVVSVIVGVVVGTRDNAAVFKTPSPTTSPAPSTSPPSISSSPSTAPSVSPSTQPSVQPTISIENLDNTLLEEAHPLVLRGAPLINNLSPRASSQTISIDCGALASDRVTGLWYAYRPRTSGPVSVVACGVSAGIKLQVYVDQDGSGSVACVLDEISRGDLDTCNGDAVTWFARGGTDYVVLVESSLPENQSTEFSIKIADNDFCPYAFGPITPTSLGVDLPYTTDAATPDRLHVPRSCGGASESVAPGVWYVVEGNGRLITATTCAQDNPQGLLNTQITVYQGTCTETESDLQCISGNDDFTCGSQSTVEWPSQQGALYYVVVHGSEEQQTGQFRLRITSDDDRKENDFCETAEPLLIGANETWFNFGGSSPNQNIPACTFFGNQDGSSPIPFSLWYSIEGTGSLICVEVSSTSVSSVIMNIYRGSNCGQLDCFELVESPQAGIGCVGGGVFSSCFETQCVNSVPGETIHVLVSSEDRDGVDEIHRIEATAGL